MNTTYCDSEAKKATFRAALARVRLPRDRKFVCARLLLNSNAEAVILATGHPITRPSAHLTAARALRRAPVVAALTAGLDFIEEVLTDAAGADAIAIQPTRRK